MACRHVKYNISRYDFSFFLQPPQLLFHSEYAATVDRGVVRRAAIKDSHGIVTQDNAVADCAAGYNACHKEFAFLSVIVCLRLGFI